MSRISTTAGKCGCCCRCGKGWRTKMAREAPLAGVGRFRGFRNGRKIRVPLPLWQGRRTGAPQRAGNRSGRKGWRTEEIWNGGTSWSFLPKGLRRPHPRNLPYGDERSQNIHQEHSSRHDSSDHQYGQRSRSQHRPWSQGLGCRIDTEKLRAYGGRLASQHQIDIEHQNDSDTHRYSGRPTGPAHCAEPQPRRSGAHRLTDTVFVLILPRAQQPEREGSEHEIEDEIYPCWPAACSPRGRPQLP